MYEREIEEIEKYINNEAEKLLPEIHETYGITPELIPMKVLIENNKLYIRGRSVTSIPGKLDCLIDDDAILYCIGTRTIKDVPFEYEYIGRANKFGLDNYPINKTLLTLVRAIA